MIQRLVSQGSGGGGGVFRKREKKTKIQDRCKRTIPRKLSFEDSRKLSLPSQGQAKGREKHESTWEREEKKEGHRRKICQEAGQYHYTLQTLPPWIAQRKTNEGGEELQQEKGKRG